MTTENPIYSGLVPEFAAKLPVLEGNCLARGITVKPYFGLRTPVEQTKLWCQSRLTSEIEQEYKILKASNCLYLVSCFDSVGIHGHGPWATNALPGQSWHQWGEAMDYMWIDHDKINWTVNKADPNNGYLVLEEEAKKLGLSDGLDWHHPDSDHIQLRTFNSPMDAGYTMQQIDKAMHDKFNNAISK